MENFKIVITKAELNTFWYAKHIGEEFLVVGTTKLIGNSCFIVEKDGDTETYAVSFTDCELA